MISSAQIKASISVNRELLFLYWDIGKSISEKVQQLVGQIPWGQNILIITKASDQNPTIGLLLCKSKSKIVAEYALRGMTKPIGIAEYDLSKAIPEDLKTTLPTIEAIEEELCETYE